MKILMFILSFLVGYIVFLPHACGQELETNGLAVALIIDNSGSMKTNDPNALRLEAAKKAVTLLGENDQVCIIGFSDQASILVPLRMVGNDASRSEILSKISAIDANGETDIKGGLENAFSELLKADQNKKRTAIFLSDGEVDLPYLLQDPKAMVGYMGGIDKIIGDYKSLGCAIHCIALQKEEAGQLLKKIAQQTGGDYFFVKEASDLTNFFQSILLVQKNFDIELPKLSYTFESKNYKAGEKFPVYACLKTGVDTLVPGPYLQMEKFNLLLSYNGQEEQIVSLKDDGQPTSGDELAGDGIFSARVNCMQEGDVTLNIISQGLYRGKNFIEQAVLGKIKISPEFSQSQLLLKRLHLFNMKLNAINWQNYIKYSIVAIIVFCTVIYLAKRKIRRDSVRIKGILSYRTDRNDNEATASELKLSTVSKGEILVSTKNENGVNFNLPKVKRDFSFKIIKICRGNKAARHIKEFSLVDSEISYLVTCQPGTYLLHEKLPKSRLLITHKESFEIEGYIFEFILLRNTNKKKNSGVITNKVELH